jgi:hypothetical protein
VQVDDLLTFRQFNKKGADDVVDVSGPLLMSSWRCFICGADQRGRRAGNGRC